MGILGTILGGAAGFALGGPAGAFAGAQIGGGIDANQARADAAEAANQFSAQQYATRYQTSVKDLEAAGLSPMLAYSQGPGSAPSGQMAQAQNPAEGASQAFNQSRLTSAQVANIEADTANKAAQAELISAQAAAARASAGQSVAQTDLINQTVQKTVAEIENVKADKFRIDALTNQLAKSAELMWKKGLNETEIGNNLRATLAQIEKQTGLIISQTNKVDVEKALSNLDLEAAKRFDNFGREYQQVKPVIDILRSILGSRFSR